jgi:FkbH-like protein
VIDEVSAYWINLCQTLHDHAGCSIVLSNFHALPVRPLGTAGTRSAGETNRFLRGLNEALAQRVPAFVHIHDVESLAAFYGVYRWFDPRFWYVARQPVSFECLVPYVRNVAQIIAALQGRSAKCVVLDLDNTLWGGVVGDDGPERLHIGEGDPQGEAYAAFQRYLLLLKERGVLLAVSSKNEETTALEAFATRPEMVLKRDDFVAFRANWRPKSDNVREIAATLNIGLDSIIFVDDNPAEREQVRQALPDVKVVALGAEPSDYATILDRTGWLDAVTVSAEDLTRSRLYHDNDARAASRVSAGTYADYVESLQQRAVVAPFEERYLDRIAQLTGKTNQFNLTTRRRSRSELAAMMNSPSHVTVYVRLADRFGDNGLISVLAACGKGADLWIDLWLMSCRVFSRGVEQMLCNYLVSSATEAGYRQLHGLYLPTERNALVKDHYRDLGFQYCGSFEGGDHWTLDVQMYQPFETAIQLVHNY